VHLVSPDHDGSWAIDEVTCPDAEAASEFGAAVATDGRWLAVGSPRADAGERDAGAVDIFEIAADPARTVRHVARLASPASRLSARFGAALAVEGDWLAIGEPGAGPDGEFPRAGMVHMAHRTAAGWAITESLRAPAGAVGWYGASVALAGGNLLAGAPIATALRTRAACGAAVLHALDGGRWTARQVIHPPAGMPGDGFGTAIALRDGWAAVGAPGDDTRARDAGAAWTIDLGTLRMDRVTARTPREGDGFGAGLAFGRALGTAPAGPTEFLAVSCRPDPERPLAPGAVDLYGLAARPPILLAHAAEPPPRPATSHARAPHAPLTRQASSPKAHNRGRHPASPSRQKHRSRSPAASPRRAHAPRPPAHSGGRSPRPTPRHRRSG
jgi:hypothetical protein